MFCTRCGNKVKDGSSFCPNCGQRIAARPKPETGSAAAGSTRTSPTGTGSMGTGPTGTSPSRISPMGTGSLRTGSTGTGAGGGYGKDSSGTEKKGGGVAVKVGAGLAIAGVAAVIGFGAVWLAGSFKDRGGSEKGPGREDSVMVSDQRGSRGNEAEDGETSGISGQVNSGQAAKEETKESAAPAGAGESQTVEASSQPELLESEETGGSGPAEQQEPEFILPESNVRYMTYKDLHGLDEATLRIAKNEIYARHGRLFQSEDLNQYFHSKSWYQGTIAPNDFSERVFNEFERNNVALLVAFQNGIQDGEYDAFDFMILHFQMDDGILTVVAEDDHWGNSLKGFAFSLPVSSHCNWWYVNENKPIEGKDAELRRFYEQKRAEYLQSPGTYESPTGPVIVVQGGTVVEVRQYNP